MAHMHTRAHTHTRGLQIVLQTGVCKMRSDVVEWEYNFWLNDEASYLQSGICSDNFLTGHCPFTQIIAFWRHYWGITWSFKLLWMYKSALPGYWFACNNGFFSISTFLGVVCACKCSHCHCTCYTPSKPRAS